MAAEAVADTEVTAEKQTHTLALAAADTEVTAEIQRVKEETEAAVEVADALTSEEPEDQGLIAKRLVHLVKME